MSWIGWIMLPEENGGKIVIECDIFLKEKQKDGTYDCEMPDNGFDKLDKYWGQAVWGLEHFNDSQISKGGK